MYFCLVKVSWWRSRSNKVTITENGGDFKTKAITDKDGFFTCELPQGKEYTLVALKDVFEYKEVTISTKEGKPKVYAKIEMVREPGYLFEVTMAEKYVEGKESVDAITDALIEIYNNTADTSVLVLAHHPSHTFNYTFEQGNHYTVMIRKEGYFTKRLEAFVNVDGCIMCFEGIDEIQPGQPGIADNLTAGHHMGVLVANVELEEIRMGEAIKIENIYYDLAKSEIRKDAYKPLDNLIHVLKNNPSLMVELGSHTDSQGDDQSNFKLSSDRAQAAVDYILDNSNIRKGRIQARGYGETDLVNGCKNGIKCSDRKHQQNRRTELKIVGIADYDPFADKSLVILSERRSLKRHLPRSKIRKLFNLKMEKFQMKSVLNWRVEIQVNQTLQNNRLVVAIEMEQTKIRSKAEWLRLYNLVSLTGLIIQPPDRLSLL